MNEATCVPENSGEKSSTPPLLTVHRLSKRFCRDLKRSLFYGAIDIGRELFSLPARSHELGKGEFWALRNVSLNLDRGSSLGLIGANGSGKTTLMRIISGIIKPTEGYTHCSGRTAPLLALSAGFNPILTGRENIYVNMALLGLAREEVDAIYDEVVAFSEIEHALEAPVRTYSSGMTARLGFACAIYTRPDLMLVDEVLAVGDIRFREKCQRKIRELRETGVSFLMVHHSSEIIRKICDQAVYLKQGHVISAGKVDDVVARYEEDVFLDDEEERKAKREKKERESGSKKLPHIEEMWLENAAGARSERLNVGAPASLHLMVSSPAPVSDVVLRILVLRDPAPGISKSSRGNRENVILHMQSDRRNDSYHLKSGRSKVVVEFPAFNLGRGFYELEAALLDQQREVIHELPGFKFIMHLENVDERFNLYQQEHHWRVMTTASKDEPAEVPAG